MNFYNRKQTMRDELKTIQEAIESRQLPPTFNGLLAPLWDSEHKRFHVQETYILDYKETIPTQFSDSYGAGIIRLALGFYNSFGGLVIFGVKDRALTVTGVNHAFDVESLNRVISDFSSIHIECISKLYTVRIAEADVEVACLLIPRRGTTKPARLKKALSKYLPSTIWVRDRHEVLEADVRHLPMLFSERSTLPSDAEASEKFPVHRSLPPSPATVKEFVNRGNLLTALWEWFVLGDDPRQYLHGPGGSGKSTLAFEFARLLAEHGHAVVSRTGERLDYVVYITGKETELNPHTGAEQPFVPRNFDNKSQQFAQILYHSGWLKPEEQEDIDDKQTPMHIEDLFASFSGLIVIDDIDALSRRGLDTGEELLFIKAILAKKRTRILYTLRFPPAHALSSALSIPGLDSCSEFPQFLDVCCAQFKVPLPVGAELESIGSATSRLPLLVETVIGLRRFCGNYRDALSLFEERGGDEARRYLYQREYDRLDSGGRSRQVLAGLYLLEEPVSFGTLCSLFSFASDQVSDALSECTSIFLSTFEGEDGETLYQLTPPSVQFIKNTSEQLKYFHELKSIAKRFKSEGVRSSPEDASAIASMNALIRQKRFIDIASYCEKLPRSSSVLANPQVRSLLGQAYSELGPDYRQKAREAFRFAESLNCRDIFMMRRWFNMELFSGYGMQEAVRICVQMITDENTSSRAKSEFHSKLGNCHLTKGLSLISVSRDKALTHLRYSIVAYLDGIWVGRSVRGFDLSDNLIWLERPLHRFVLTMKSDIEEFAVLIEALVEKKHDVDINGVNLLFDYLTRSPASVDAGIKKKLKSFCGRTSNKIVKNIRPIGNYPGFELILDNIELLRRQLEFTEEGRNDIMTG